MELLLWMHLLYGYLHSVQVFRYVAKSLVVQCLGSLGSLSLWCIAFLSPDMVNISLGPGPPVCPPITCLTAQCGAS